MLSASTAILLLSLIPVRPEGDRVEIVAHRGANRIAPENTMASAKKCHQLGVDWVEADVRMSSDGLFYVFHDELLNRTTDQWGLFRISSSEEIDQLDAGSWFGEQFAGEPVLKLRDLLMWARGKTRIYLDIKHADIPQLLELIDSTGMRDSVFVWSANREYLKLIHEIAPDIKIKCNARSIQEFDKHREDLEPAIVELRSQAVSTEFINHVHAHGAKVMMYMLDPNPEMFRKAMHLKVDMININYPHLFLWVEQGVQSGSAAEDS